MSAAMNGAIKVAVRVRPYLGQEEEEGLSPTVVVDGSHVTVLTRPPQIYAFDYGFWSFDEASPQYVSQEDVFQYLGKGLVDGAVSGHNVSCFAYGQTCSGKSYSIMGTKKSPGILHRFIVDLFEKKLEYEQDSSKEIRVWLSFMEIFNDCPHDLLSNGNNPKELVIASHPKVGTNIAALTEAACATSLDAQRLLDYGLKQRAVANACECYIIAITCHLQHQGSLLGRTKTGCRAAGYSNGVQFTGASHRPCWKRAAHEIWCKVCHRPGGQCYQ